MVVRYHASSRVFCSLPACGANAQQAPVPRISESPHEKVETARWRRGVQREQTITHVTAYTSCSPTQRPNCTSITYPSRQTFRASSSHPRLRAAGSRQHCHSPLSHPCKSEEAAAVYTKTVRAMEPMRLQPGKSGTPAAILLVRQCSLDR
jgi:hypothetical protein